MIRIAESARDYTTLLAIQIECIEGLTDTYTPDEIQHWVDYLKNETADRYSEYNNTVYVDDSGKIEGFISWKTTEGSSASIESLYIRNSYGGRGIGKLLLQNVEADLPGKTIHVRSTLNAQSFYERNGYIYTGKSISRAGFMISLLKKKL
jgi:ribosomal protein S18 acetylase RimI-like enzyme